MRGDNLYRLLASALAVCVAGQLHAASKIKEIYAPDIVPDGHARFDAVSEAGDEGR